MRTQRSPTKSRMNDAHRTAQQWEKSGNVHLVSESSSRRRKRSGPRSKPSSESTCEPSNRPVFSEYPGHVGNVSGRHIGPLIVADLDQTISSPYQETERSQGNHRESADPPRLENDRAVDRNEGHVGLRRDATPRGPLGISKRGPRDGCYAYMTDVIVQSCRVGAPW